MGNKEEQQLDASLVISELQQMLANAQYEVAVLNAQMNQLAKQQQEAQTEED